MENTIEEQKEALQQFLESLKKSVQQVGTETLGLSPQQLDEVRDALISGEPLYRILGMKESVIEARYTLAYQLYAAGKYGDAETLFRWLTAYASDTEAHWMGLGACRQAMENYNGAAGSLPDGSALFRAGRPCPLLLQRYLSAQTGEEGGSQNFFAGCSDVGRQEQGRA